MCITFFYLNPNTNSKLKFMIAFNRDEAADRKTLPLGPLQYDSNVYAGLDIQSGGSWLGINVKTGIMVILTNYRLYRKRKTKSRGLLVRKFLQTKYVQNMEQPTNFEQLNNKIYQDLVEILKNPTEYSAFNLSVYNIHGNKLFYICSQIQMTTPIVLQNGVVQGYSNTDINTKWRKVQRGKKMFSKIVHDIQNSAQINNEDIFDKMESVMRNCDGSVCCLKQFESSIFIRPYYSYLLRTNRMTRSSFYAIFRQDEEGKIIADIKQITYNIGKDESEFKFTLKI